MRSAGPYRAGNADGRVARWLMAKHAFVVDEPSLALRGHSAAGVPDHLGDRRKTTVLLVEQKRPWGFRLPTHGSFGDRRIVMGGKPYELGGTKHSRAYLGRYAKVSA